MSKATQHRRERERQEREQRILEVSRQMLVRDGYHGLNMDRVAEALEYSKGTIYNHFSCKEEIILALAIETMDKRTQMFERGTTFQGSSRERLQAIGVASELFVRLYPDHFLVEQVIRSSSIWEKTSEQRRNLLRMCEFRCMGIVGGIVRDGIASGDLVLPAEVNVEELVFGMWSLSFGAFSIIATSDSLVELGIRDGFEAVRLNITHMLDGYGWKPLSKNHDYLATVARVQEEVFRDESQTAQARR
ncbi:MAG: AcrR family transcriptional regulator [Pirellulaceae bacterium]|jgi:AcrR family transcriptional regulator